MTDTHSDTPARGSGKVSLGGSELHVSRLCLGGNVFGWTADQAQSFAVLDAFAAGGGNFVDTADVYSAWVPGHRGGESETVLGAWLRSRGNRDEMVIGTKVGGHPAMPGISAANIQAATEGCLRRLGVERIDLLYTHWDFPETPVEEFVPALDALVRAGKVRAVAASNISAARLSSALDFAAREGMAAYVAVQPHYNLVSRRSYEGPLATVVAARGLSCLPYYALASGFLTGKYRPGGGRADSGRGHGAADFLNDPRALRVLSALDKVADLHDTEPATVALAWLNAQPTVAAPIASARTVEQLPALLDGARLALTAEDLELLDAASN
ncbi:aldo/keto reductase [Kitasatospora sp. NPDC002227]|uniref:aldo/keto reductase n=1 Tax=Kitasatospora sp. NPDC002227 TaxID=3154773 RepID=UPI003323C5D1